MDRARAGSGGEDGGGCRGFLTSSVWPKRTGSIFEKIPIGKMGWGSGEGRLRKEGAVGYHGCAAAGADQDCAEGMGTNAPSQTVKQQRTHSQSIRVQIDLLSLKTIDRASAPSQTVKQQRTHSQSIRVQIDLLSLKTIDRTSAPSQTVKQQKTAFPLWLRRWNLGEPSSALTRTLVTPRTQHLHHNGKAFLLLSLPEFRA